MSVMLLKKTFCSSWVGTTKSCVASFNGQRRGLDFPDGNLGYYHFAVSNGMMIFQEVTVILGTYHSFSLSAAHSSKKSRSLQSFQISDKHTSVIILQKQTHTHPPLIPFPHVPFAHFFLAYCHHLSFPHFFTVFSVAV